MNLKPDRNKINVEMARKKWGISQLAEAYGVSRVRMNIILNSQQLTPICIGRLAEALSVSVEAIIEE